MKELKFRVWLENVECVRGIDGELVWNTESYYDYDPVIDNNGLLDVEAGWDIQGHSDEKYTIEQYTGLKDKNGKEIYEGDIVDVIFPTKLRGVEEHQIWVCRFGVKRAGFVLNRETNARIFSLTFGEINAKNLAVEVIGNIHENADLLGEK